MFSLESINGFLMWHFSNGKDSNIVDTDTFTTNLAGEKYIRYVSYFLTQEILWNKYISVEFELRLL